MTDVYHLLQLSAMTAQEIRSSDDEVHNPDCTHRHCVAEREARRDMEALPEHKEKQSSWVKFMRELRDAARESHIEEEPQEEINEFNMFDGTTC